jgi:hypothetical protein
VLLLFFAFTVEVLLVEEVRVPPGVLVVPAVTICGISAPAAIACFD